MKGVNRLFTQEDCGGNDEKRNGFFEDVRSTENLLAQGKSSNLNCRRFGVDWDDSKRNTLWENALVFDRDGTGICTFENGFLLVLQEEKITLASHLWGFKKRWADGQKGT